MEKKSGLITVVIVVLALLVGLLGGYVLKDMLTDKNQGSNDTNNTGINNNNNNDIQNNNNVLQGKIHLSEHCDEKSCNKELGKITINNVNYLLSVNLTNTNSVTTGTIKLGNKSINIENYVPNKKLDGFEVYDKYFILYAKGEEQEGNVGSTTYHEYAFVIFNDKLEQLTMHSAHTCGDINDIKFNNNKVIFPAMNTQVEGLSIYNHDLNVNKYDIMDVTYEMTIEDVINKKWDNNKKLSINYNCGDSQR